MVSALASGSGRPVSSTGRCVLGQGTLPSQFRSPSRCIKGYRLSVGG